MQEPKSYLCYISRTDRPLSDLAVVSCEVETELADAVDDLLRDVGPYQRVDVFDGDRCVMVKNAASAAA